MITEQARGASVLVTEDTVDDFMTHEESDESLDNWPDLVRDGADGADVLINPRRDEPLAQTPRLDVVPGDLELPSRDGRRGPAGTRPTTDCTGPRCRAQVMRISPASS